MALCKEFIAFRWQTAPSDHLSRWGTSFLGISRGGCRSSNFQRERRSLPAKSREEPAISGHSGNRNKI